MNSAQVEFRPDIQALRAIAILLVIAAHIKIPFLSGGFIGVDVFFVVSGFLMTKLLLNELLNTGSVDLIRFYANRFRRLLPPLLLVFITTVASAILFLSPLEQLSQVGAAKMVPVWLTNIYFTTSDINYFGPQAESNLFLHTWSLGVEEQFYLFWPALILFLMGAWSWQKDRRNEKSLISLLAVTVVIGYLFSLFLSIVQPKFAFYSVFSRMWQFGLGGLTFLIFASKSTMPLSNKNMVSRIMSDFGGALATLGIIGILASAVLLSGKQLYPGYWALLPSIATCFVLAGNSNVGSKDTLWINSRILQFLGNVSYGWYLWHWPVLLVGSLLVLKSGVFMSAMLMLLALALAYFTYFFIEAPLRTNHVSNKSPRLVIIVSLLLMALSFFAIDSWRVHAEAWTQQPSQKAYLATQIDVPEIYQAGCDNWFYSSELVPCVAGNPVASKTAVLIGDSIGAQWFSAAASAFPKDQWRFVVLTKSSCPMVDVKIFYDRIGREYVECQLWRDKVVKWIQKESPTVVIIGSAEYLGTLDERKWIDGSSRFFEKILPSTDKMIVLVPTPTLPFNGPSCLARHAWKPGWTKLRGECEVLLEGGRSNIRVGKWLEVAASHYPKVQVIYTDDLICPGSLCKAERDGIVVYRDNQHLTNTFVRAASGEFTALLSLHMDSTGLAQSQESGK